MSVTNLLWMLEDVYPFIQDVSSVLIISLCGVVSAVLDDNHTDGKYLRRPSS